MLRTKHFYGIVSCVTHLYVRNFHQQALRLELQAKK